MSTNIAEALKNHINVKSVTKPELIKRLPDPVLNVLNEQIKNELVSSQIYRAMASWLDDKGWSNGSKLFFKYADEELTHMNKIYNYLYDRNCKAIVPECPKVKTEYSSMREILEDSLKHEFEVSANWMNIADVALANKCHVTYEMALWFQKEQNEEEIKFRDLLFKLDLGMPDWAFEQHLGTKL